MAVNNTPIATDSAAELHNLIGDDASATFESDPNFVHSNPTGSASSDHLTLRDTDDTEDSEEEEVEEDDEDEDIDEDDEDEDVDEDEDEDAGDEGIDDPEDDEDDDADEVLKAAEPVDVHGPGKRSRKDVEDELNEMEDEPGENPAPTPEDKEEHEEQDLDRDRAIDEALRMSATEIAGQTY